MKSLVELLELLVLDCMRKSGAPLRRDVETLRHRVEHEGDSFITITLPAFCQDFEKSLDEGRIAPGSWPSFGKTKTGIPEFLQGLLCNVFGPDGSLLNEPSVSSIRLVRQICLFGKKILRPCSEEREEDATAKFVQCEDEVVESLGGDTLFGVFEEVAAIIMDSIPILQGRVFIDSIVPDHGPGATRERILGNQKWNFRRWHSRLENVGFTFSRFGRSNSVYLNEEGQIAVEGIVPDFIPPSDEEPVRVVFVPKTLKSPRVIAVEPVCMQYAQQGLSRLLVRGVETSRLTAGHVNFRDQSINQKLAQKASQDGISATLDMSEASDRVALAHVHALFDTVPVFRSWVMAARSTRAQLPNGEVIHLSKFASMGSALCFPVEALVFFTSIIAIRLHRAGIQPTAQNVHSFGRAVYVYGDDLIVPANEAPAICDDLEAMGFKVNRRKSFWTGKFRESCGSDCYDNEEVTPVYLRRDPPTDRADCSGILSSVATANQLYSAGYWRTAAALREAVEKVVGKLPQVSDKSSAIGWNHHSEVVLPRRWNEDLQRAEMRALVPVSPKAKDSLEGSAALAKCFRIIGKDLPIDPKHLLQSVKPYGLALKRRWVPLTL
ncbi:RNA-directed RNA polymerase [ssRNA phage Gerhypos.4_41]|uniref:RNA-directed RNA polymerase n=2 Tax=Leviviricetes TaxID=2842243 RepID=A0A8S5L1H9_9VIRU|nr:RNA-directed RNA polymerase [ssRNA phage Gerhypos.4_41]QDH90270.1 MAG: RNA-dependent RNA polymerase [Leviviridae sp.]DAD51279.1 TPA_asm: RNA-directed RNA polymerase [ssRNA phage Gerhypos.4_41]